MKPGRAPVALTVGEPAGIGPELAVKAWEILRGEFPILWIGDPAHLPPGSPCHEVTAPAEAAGIMPRALPVLRHDFVGPAVSGQPDPAHACSVIEVIDRAVRLVEEGAASALCTAPIHKKALIDGAGFAYPGHTEYLAALSGAPRPVMMLASPLLRVIPVTIHIPLARVPTALTAELLEDTIRIAETALRRDFGLAHPRLAVAGLNPHAGEGGAIGSEEIDMVEPVLDRLRAEGLAITGPLSADTMFHDAARKGYDAAIAMYHDQALIPIKTLDFDRGVNVTLGLPFVRTSPDHGTALDIAGRGRANPSSTVEALRMAHAMAIARGTAPGAP